MPEKADDAEGITAFDASKVLEHAAGLTTLTGDAFTAGDVNRNGSVSSMDAFYILQKSVELISLPFPGAGHVWIYDPVSRDLTGLSGNVSNQDFTGVLLGDVSGNWSAAMGAAQSAMKTSLAALGETTVTVTIEGSPSEPGGAATARVLIEPNGDSYQSFDFEFQYDPAKMTLTDVAAGTAASTWMLKYNEPAAGRVLVSMASEQPINTSENMVELSFQLVDAGSSNPLYLTAGTIDEDPIPTTMGFVGGFSDTGAFWNLMLPAILGGNR